MSELKLSDRWMRADRVSTSKVKIMGQKLDYIYGSGKSTKYHDNFNSYLQEQNRLESGRRKYDDENNCAREWDLY